MLIPILPIGASCKKLWKILERPISLQIDLIFDPQQIYSKTKHYEFSRVFQKVCCKNFSMYKLLKGTLTRPGNRSQMQDPAALGSLIQSSSRAFKSFLDFPVFSFSRSRSTLSNLLTKYSSLTKDPSKSANFWNILLEVILLVKWCNNGNWWNWDGDHQMNGLLRIGLDRRNSICFRTQ